MQTVESYVEMLKPVDKLWTAVDYCTRSQKGTGVGSYFVHPVYTPVRSIVTLEVQYNIERLCELIVHTLVYPPK